MYSCDSSYHNLSDQEKKKDFKHVNNGLNPNDS